MPAARTTPGGQRGVALITAILIVALATILATRIGFEGALEQRRSTTAMLLDQAYLVGLGAEAWAASYLKKDLADSKTDHFGERWATPIPPIPIEGGVIEGRVEDMQGRFNLNNLVTPEGAVNREGLREFQNLLDGARARAEVGGHPGRLARYRHAAELPGRCRGQHLHLADSALPGRQRTDHERE